MVFLQDCIHFRGLFFNIADEHLFIEVMFAWLSYEFGTYLNACLV